MRLALSTRTREVLSSPNGYAVVASYLKLIALDVVP